MTSTIDADKATPEEMNAAIAHATSSDETLSIMRGGKLHAQVVRPKPPAICKCTSRLVGAICLDCDGTVDVDARLVEMNGHRNQWRRIAFRLHDELAKRDAELAKAILEGQPEEEVVRR